MKNNLKRWLAREQEWAAHWNKKKKRETVLYALGVPLGGIALVLLTSFLTPEGERTVSTLTSLKYVLMIAGAIDVLVIVSALASMPGRRYMKQLKVYLNSAFTSDAEREELASQMMGAYGKDTVICIPWTETGYGEQRVWVTRDYLLSTRLNGQITMVFLNQVQSIETEDKEYSYRAGDGENIRARVRNVIFMIHFSYKEMTSLDESVRKFRGDKVKLGYPTRELREQVLAAVSKLRREE